MDPQGEGYACQEIVFDSIGSKILENAFKGLLKCKMPISLKYEEFFFRLQRMHFCLRTDRVWKIIYHDGF